MAVEITTVEEAARRLATTRDALVKRCARNARRVGKDVVAHLAPGVDGIKLGRWWRVRFTADG
jgi:hypothetical protein